MARMEILEEDATENVAFVEGVEEAKLKVKEYLHKKVYSNVETESETILEVHHGSTPGMSDPVAMVSVTPGEPIDKVVDEVVEGASEFAEGLERGKVRFTLRIDGQRGMLAFTLKVVPKDDDEDDMDDIDDLPNRKGLLMNVMRHQHATQKLMLQQARENHNDKRAEMRMQKDRIEQLERHQIDALKAFEELVSGRHQRDMELRKIDREEKKQDQLLGMLGALAPILIAKFLGGPAGPLPPGLLPGAPPQAPQAPTAPVATEAPKPTEGATTVIDLEKGAIDLIDNLTTEQLRKLKEMLSPEQINGLVGIARYVQDRREPEPPKEETKQ